MGFFDRFKRSRSDEVPNEVREIYSKIATEAEGRMLADKAISYRNVGNFAKAFELLNLALTQHSYKPAVVLIGTTAIIKGDFQAARKWLTSSIKAYADDKDFLLFELYANLGSLYHNHFKDDVKAMQAYKLALAVPRSDTIPEEGYSLMVGKVHHDMAMVYWAIGDVLRSRNYAGKSLKVLPDCERCSAIVENVFVAQDRNGEAIGSVVRGVHGKNSMDVVPGRPNALQHCSALVFAQEIQSNDRLVFSKWAGMPANGWTSAHVGLCALAMMHYYANAKSRSTTPQAVANIATLIDKDLLRPLPKPLTEEVMRIFDRMFGG